MRPPAMHLCKVVKLGPTLRGLGVYSAPNMGSYEGVYKALRSSHFNIGLLLLTLKNVLPEMHVCAVVKKRARCISGRLTHSSESSDLRVSALFFSS